MSKISLMILTWNSEAVLRTALESVKGVVDEIVAVDSASVDGTVEILKEYGAKVYTMELKDSWDELKNFAVEKTSHEWILSIDSDEEMTKEAAALIPELVKSSDVDCYAFRRLNYLDDVLQELKEYHPRLFRRYCRFVGNIHEQLVGFKKIQIMEEAIIHSKTWKRQIDQNARYIEFSRQLEQNVSMVLHVKKKEVVGK